MEINKKLFDIWCNDIGFWKFLIPFKTFINLKLDEIIKYKLVKLNLNIS